MGPGQVCEAGRMTCDYGRWVHSNSLADLRGEMNGILFLFLPIESLARPDIKTWCRAPLKIFPSLCVARPALAAIEEDI